VTSPVLDVQGLTIRLPRGADRLNAVENVSFAVGPGEIVCVVGESGSGKSVTAHSVMGLLPPDQLTATAGRALLEGDDLLTKTPAEMRRIRGDRISMIFQEPMTALNPVMKVGDQVAEVLDIHTNLSERERRARVLAVMQSVHLPEPERLTIVPSSVLYPITRDEGWADQDRPGDPARYPDAYAMHHWTSSWWRGAMLRSVRDRLRALPKNR